MPGGGSRRDPDRSSSLLSSEDDKYLVASHRLVARTSCLINLPLPQARFSWSSHERKPYQPTDTAKYPKHAYPSAELKAAGRTQQTNLCRSTSVPLLFREDLRFVSDLFLTRFIVRSCLMRHAHHSARATRFLAIFLHWRKANTDIRNVTAPRASATVRTDM